jgi:hypothetical protein
MGRNEKTEPANGAVTGAFVVLGGIGIAKDIYIGSTNETTDINSGAIITSGGVGISKSLYVGGTLESTSSTTGSLVVIGGAAIQHNLYVGKSLFITETSLATDSTTGGLSVMGGIGVGGNIFMYNDDTTITTGSLIINGGGGIYLPTLATPTVTPAMLNYYEKGENNVTWELYSSSYTDTKYMRYMKEGTSDFAKVTLQMEGVSINFATTDAVSGQIVLQGGSFLKTSLRPVEQLECFVKTGGYIDTVGSWSQNIGEAVIGTDGSITFEILYCGGAFSPREIPTNNSIFNTFIVSYITKY